MKNLTIMLSVSVLVLLLVGCQAPNPNQGMMLSSIAGDALELTWTPTDPKTKVDLLVFDALGKKLDLEMELNRNSAKIKELDPGEYDFRLYTNTPKGAKLLGAYLLKIQAARKSSQILKPEDFGIASSLGLQTLLAYTTGAIGPDQELMARARGELQAVSRNLTEVFLGPTYPVTLENEVYDIEMARGFLLGQNFKLAHGFAARSLLVMDLRLPEADAAVPCQLSLRLFDIAHPHNKNEFLWNRRPLIYEDFVEIPRFRHQLPNYDVFIRALSLGFKNLCSDQMVRSYCKFVQSGNENETAYTTGLWERIGRRVPVGEGKAGIMNVNYPKAEELMFPQRVFTPRPGAETSNTSDPVPPVPTSPEKPKVSEPVKTKPVKPVKKPSIPIFDPKKLKSTPQATAPVQPKKSSTPPVKAGKPKPTKKPGIPIFNPTKLPTGKKATPGKPVKKVEKTPAQKEPTKATEKSPPKKSSIPIFDPKKVGTKKSSK